MNVLRSALLYMSRQVWLRRWAETSHLALRVTSRFVAGQELETCLAACRQLQQQGVLITLDHLGESISNVDEAAGARHDYLLALQRIQEEKLDSSVSIKLSQFGLLLDQGVCRNNVRALVAKAQAAGTRVEIDMEDSSTTDRTLDLVREMHEQFGCVRAVLQAYLYRTEADIREMNRLKIPVRLCKGAYKEPESVAFALKPQVDENYKKLTRLLLTEGTYPALATHDEAMIAEARKIVAETGLSKEAFEFQMLYGIRRDLQTALVGEGFRMRAYVPYGNAWYPYFMRRLAERPANVWFIAKNFVRA